MKDMDGHALAEATANCLNTTLDDLEIDMFVKRMACEHRTLQQGFTRLCATWLKHLASLNENQYDARNAASVEYAKRVVKATDDYGRLPTI
jgi:hypothetical protein